MPPTYDRLELILRDRCDPFPRVQIGWAQHRTARLVDSPIIREPGIGLFRRHAKGWNHNHHASRSEHLQRKESIATTPCQCHRAVERHEWHISAELATNFRKRSEERRVGKERRPG